MITFADCVIIFPIDWWVVIIWCYYLLQSANVITFVLSFFLVPVGCYHLCYHLMLSFFVIISPLFSFSWKRDTLEKNKENFSIERFSPELERYCGYKFLKEMLCIFVVSVQIFQIASFVKNSRISLNIAETLFSL